MFQSEFARDRRQTSSARFLTDCKTTFVGLKSDSPGPREAIKAALEALGPLLAQSLARNIGGNASRSELDKLSEPVKKLVSRHPKAKEWLQSGLSHDSFPSDKVSSEQKMLFVKKLIRYVPSASSWPSYQPASN